MAICSVCNREMTKAVSCTQTHILFNDEQRVARIRYGDEDPAWDSDVPCHDCGVVQGGYHHPGCDVEQCPRCGGQLISCHCGEEVS